MKTTILISSVLLVTAALARAATNDPTAMLQRGLFEEEANHNLPAAIQAYQSVIDQFDQDRKLAATAVFRLGECYRRQGETNKASAQYERVLGEFSDQTPLLTLSQQSLAAMGVPFGGATTTSSTAAARQEQKRLLEEEIKLVEKKLDAQQRQIQNGIIGQDVLWTTQRDLLELRRQIAALDAGAPVTVAAAEASAPAPTNEEAEEVKKIQAMIKDSPDLINAKNQNNSGWTPLYQAAMKGQIVVATFLLQHGADVDGKDNSGKTPLYAAAAMGHRSMVELLLQHHADVKSSGSAALHAAASKGFRSIAELLLARGADVNARTPTGSTALHMAVANGFKAVVELLLAHGADVNAVTEQLEGVSPQLTGTPLHMAAQLGDMATADLLLGNKANIEAKNKYGQTPLVTASGLGQAKVVQLLLDRGANINAADNKGMTPLCHAVTEKREEATRVLLTSGANPNVKFDSYNGLKGFTPLLAATVFGPVDTVQLLLDHKAEPNVKSESGDTPILNALQRPNPDERHRMVTALLESGADVNVRDRDGRTPLLRALAFDTNDRDLIRLLLAHKADVNAQDSHGVSALHVIASSSRSQAVAEDLLAAGANVNALDKNGKTPLNYALSFPGQGPLEFAEFLRRHGAAEYVSNPRAIEIRRGQSYSATVFTQGTNDWNQFRLLDLLAVHMGLLSGSPAGETRSLELAGTLFANGAFGPGGHGLSNPDFSRVRIRRPTKNPAVWQDTYVDLAAMLQLGECSKNVPLGWGDVVEIPSADRPRGAEWREFGRQEMLTFMRCLARKVTVSFGGASTNLLLHLEEGQGGSIVTRESFWIRPVLFRLAEKMEPAERASLDFSHVKVSRYDTVTGQQRQFVVDCTLLAPSPAPAPDLWLLDGDVIDVPKTP